MPDARSHPAWKTTTQDPSPKEEAFPCRAMRAHISSSPIAKPRGVIRPTLSTSNFGRWASLAGKSPGRASFGSISAHPPLSCRYDQRAGALTKDGMKHGIENAAAFLVFLSAGILERSFCE